jgi:hypothetical protein
MGLPCNAPGQPPPPPPIPVDTLAEAYNLCNSLSLPPVQLKVSPATGMVNIAAYFYVNGYHGETLFTSRSWTLPYEPTTIDIRAIPMRYTWNFGDGGETSTTYLPQQASDDTVKNTYGWSSTTERGGSFHASVTVTWSGQYQVNGGGWQDLTTVTRSYEALVPVQQSQPIITHP